MNANKSKVMQAIVACCIAAAALAGTFSASSVNAAEPKDPLYEKQHYLRQIGMPEAWKSIEGRTLAPVTVAVVDTGSISNIRSWKAGC